LSTYYNIKNRLVNELLVYAEAKLAAEIVLGLRYCAVKLDSGETGLAFSALDNEFLQSDFVGGKNPLSGKPVVELLWKLESHNQLERAVGLAAANALANIKERILLEGDVLKYLNVLPTDKVAMIGHFQPLEPRLKPLCAELKIFEIDDDRLPGVLHYNEIDEFLPQSNIILITGAAFVNDTIDDILPLCTNSRETVILGASTPLVPEAFARTPVTLLSGVKIIASHFVLRSAAEGGGYQRFKPGIKKVNLKVERIP